MFSSNYLFVIVILLTGLVSWCAPSVPPDVRATPAVKAVSRSLPWVVSVNTENLIQVNDGYETLYHEFFGRIRRPRQKIVKNMEPLGSGIIVSRRGLVITNFHVVRRASKLEVNLWDNTRYRAEVIGYDVPNDLALLRIVGDIPEGKLQEASFGKPDDLYLGETVLTIGNPFGLEHSVSQGVLSAINRNYTEDDQPFGDILQTDAAINPGNSGGPLINLNGDIIGINQAIRRDASGIGFAIPTKRIEIFLAHWLLPSRFSDGYMGIDGDCSITSGSHGGIVFKGILPDSPAGKAGLKDGDEITAVNGAPVTRLLDFGRAIWHLKMGSSVGVTLSDGRTLSFTIDRMPDGALLDRRLGMRVQTLTPELCEAVDLPKTWKGVVLNDIQPETAYSDQQTEWRKTLKRGDIIVKVNDTPVTGQKEFADLIRRCPNGASVAMVALVYDYSQSSLVMVRFNATLK